MQAYAYDIIESPIITEKAVRHSAESNQYSFKVNKRANKTDVKRAIETIYGVEVISVKIMNVRGKIKRVRYQLGRTASWKKAIVRLKAGQKIDFA
ncbi:MAG: 50S ribosomal protein L23 [Candidatus Omnitrophica bacterium]|nr:50S ribosomal protein L23 [Candidatus Omnitrophota bacterium]